VSSVADTSTVVASVAPVAATSASSAEDPTADPDAPEGAAFAPLTTDVPDVDLADSVTVDLGATFGGSTAADPSAASGPSGTAASWPSSAGPVAAASGSVGASEAVVAGALTVAGPASAPADVPTGIAETFAADEVGASSAAGSPAPDALTGGDPVPSVADASVSADASVVAGGPVAAGASVVAGGPTSADVALSGVVAGYSDGADGFADAGPEAEAPAVLNDGTVPPAELEQGEAVEAPAMPVAAEEGKAGEEPDSVEAGLTPEPHLNADTEPAADLAVSDLEPAAGSGKAGTEPAGDSAEVVAGSVGDSAKAGTEPAGDSAEVVAGSVGDSAKVDIEPAGDSAEVDIEPAADSAEVAAGSVDSSAGSGEQSADPGTSDDDGDGPAEAIPVVAEPERPGVRLLSRPLGSAPLLDSEPIPATRPGMLRPRPPADPPAAGTFTLHTPRFGPAVPPGAA
jgi:arginase